MNKNLKNASIYIAIFIGILILVMMTKNSVVKSVELSYNEFNDKLGSDQIQSLSIDGNKITGQLSDQTLFETYIPSMLSPITGEKISELEGKKITGVPPANTPFFIEILPTIIMILLIVVFWFVFMQNSQGGGSRVMSFGKSRAKMVKDSGKKITFADVAGLKEEKEEMQEIVDFLKNPRKYLALGARIPKGILMVGPPGTGKTYLSKACAGEAGVPFYTISGSDFVEMFVGVGASRVRDLFEEAKKNSPCIVFIDEIDAVGRKRGAGLGGGHDEREQTLNQLLVEMDGFGDNQGIIIIAATNRPDILDPALLRPGRFDRQVMIGVPDIREREQILKVHAKNKPTSDDVNYQILSQSTPGFTPADLENVMNEAALLSARNDDKVIRMETIKQAIIKVIAGVEKKSKLVSPKERKLTAYHEAGHAVLAQLLPDTDPVHQVTIIPRGRTGGFTMQLPEEDRSYATKKSMEKELIILLGGRVAESLILDDISTGAQNDLSRVTKVARAMVTKYAMSDNLGSMSYDTEDEVFLGRDFTSMKNYSEHVAAEIDREVRNIVDNSYDKARTMLEQNLDKLHVIAEALLKYETISGDEFRLAFEQGMDVLNEKITSQRTKVEEEKRVAKELEEREKAAYDKLNEKFKEINEDKASIFEAAKEEEITLENDKNKS
ncbi:ATP-dependent zinc metalloprotease FtsH [Fusibacter ferrireducens]|uniref:ATP-dependent zinc metalloprotease FtsH n=1 Tax=Fusibacter ferrireducens TaxID=2785058 RepID=A0ABR9ZZK4_9FIRM|nr:ATP-dependent zinc metalloprotease FtsH [Fusibacter ferrireducens]MBF4695613.1 ATP-dependent zinc metalloprotease FtsH [Fusibacter ferrireducens]